MKPSAVLNQRLLVVVNSGALADAGTAVLFIKYPIW
jgi:hypothetical protein